MTRPPAAFRFGCLLLGLLTLVVLQLHDTRDARAAVGFSTTGSLAAARTDHTATRLNKDLVLIVGGRGTSALASAELYDLKTGKFSSTGSLKYPRYGHAAALLPNGDVLIAGGIAETAGTTLLPLERYSVANGTFSVVSGLTSPRLFPTATTLADGRVLIAGGYSGGTYFASAQLFDPTTNSVSDTAKPLTYGRFRHAAVLLDRGPNGGKVLIAGGQDRYTYHASAELFDPGSNSFTSAGLATPRSDAAVALLADGRVLFAGGEGGSSPQGATKLTSAEVYDPMNARFAMLTAALPEGRVHGIAARLNDGRVLITGGRTDSGVAASALLFRPASNTFTTAGTMMAQRTGHTAMVLSDGKVLIAAGDNGTALNSAELYTPESISRVTLQPAAGNVISSTTPNVTVNVSATGTSGTNDTITVTLTDAAGVATSQSVPFTIDTSGTTSKSVSFTAGALGTATISATDTFGTTIAPASVTIQPTGFTLLAPPSAVRSGDSVPVQLLAQAAGGAETKYYRGTPSLFSAATPPATYDTHFTGFCPQFSSASASCAVNFGDLGQRAFAAFDGATTVFAPLPVVPRGFQFAATDAQGRPTDFSTYRSGTPLTLTVTATAKPDAITTGYDGTGFSVSLASNDRAPLARSTNPVGGVATFTGVTFVKLGGQTGSPFTPALTATDSQLAQSTTTQNLVVGPEALTVTPSSNAVRSGTTFTLSITADAAGGAPDDRAAYTGTLALAAPSDTAATLPANVPFASADAGAKIVSVTLRSLGAQSITVQDSVTGVSATTSLTIAPLALAFQSGPATAPAGASANYTLVPTAAGGGPGVGTTTGYTGSVTLTATGPGATVTTPVTKPCTPSCAFTVSFAQPGTVTLDASDDSTPAATAPTFTVRVTTPSALAVTPANLSFTTVTGGTPATQAVTIRHTGDNALAWNATVATASGGAWLGGSAANGTTPATVDVSAVATGLRAGRYTGTLTITANGAVGGAVTVDVTLTVTEPPTFTLTTSANPTGAGTIDVAPAGGPYPANTVVRLTPRPATGYAFTGWTVNGQAAGTATPLALTMNRDHAVVANFAPATAPPAPPAPPAPTPGVPPVWTDWNGLGGVLTDAPAATSFNGRGYVFARGSDNALYVKSSADGATWTGWQSLGGALTGAPATTAHNGRLYVFTKGSDNGLYLRSSPDGVTFTDWQPLGGILRDAPAAASVNGLLHVFARGTGDRLYVTRSTDGVSFSGWQDLGGLLTAAPAATGFQGRLYVFAKGSDNALYETHSADGVTFTAWRSYGGVLTAAPAATTYTPVGGAETLVVVARGSDNALYERRSGDGASYTEWSSLGGQAIGPPAATALGGRLYVIARGSDDRLWERHVGP